MLDVDLGFLELAGIIDIDRFRFGVEVKYFPASFSMTIAGHDKVPVEVSADWQSVAGKVILSLQKGQAEDTLANAFMTAWCGGDQMLNLSLTDAVGNDRPGLSTTSVKLKMLTSGC